MDDKYLEVLQKQTEILSALSSEMRTKAPATQGTAVELHGDGSLFGNESLERDVITAHVRPQGIGSVIPAFATVTERPYFATITGFTDTTGNEPTNPCDDAPAGYMKGAYLTAQFGRVVRDTQTIDISKVMLQRNRGDFTDLQLRGRLLGGIGGPLTPASMSEQGVLNIVTKSEMITAGVNMERKLSVLTWQGAVANNTAGGGYKEFPGLDNQITTGHVDAETNTAAPALDSDVKSFAYNEIGGTGLDIVEYLSMIEYYVRYNAERMGLMPVQWAVSMRPELWFELSAVWPCSYLSHRCATSAGANPIVINDNTNVAMRDAMRDGKYIDINGNRYPVILDTGIYERNNANDANLAAGEYASDIYFVPLTISGGMPVTYWEHVDYRAAVPDIRLLNGNEMFWSDGGRFMWAMEETNFCYKLKLLTEPRVILRTPQLAGRLQLVKYTPLQHLRDADPASPYFYDGGVSMRSDTTFNAVWN